MKVFISWSGEHSKNVAIALRQWLQNVIQTLEPWLSTSDIDKGTRWSTDIARHLEESRVGIICLTANNLTAPWILFEAGALSKTIEQTYVCTYLIGIDPADVESPLSQFQATRANKDDTRELIKTINKAQGEKALSEEMIDNAFEKWWPDLEKSLVQLENSDRPIEVKREQRELVEEILELTRSQSRILEELRASVPSQVTHTKPYRSQKETVSPEEVIPAIKKELEKRRKTLLVMALEESEVELRVTPNGDWFLLATFTSENMFSKRISASEELISEIGEEIWGSPIGVKVEILADKQPSDEDIPF